MRDQRAFCISGRRPYRHEETMSVSDSEFTKDELALIEQARQETEGGTSSTTTEGTEGTNQQAANEAREQDGLLATEGGEQAEKTPATPAASAAPAAAERPAGDLRVALRASRRGETRARSEAEQLRLENEALKAKLTPEKPAGEVDEELMKELESDFPQVAGVVKALAKQVNELKATAKTTETEERDPEFVPPMLPPDLQDVVDEIPDLLAWQMDPNQTNFEMAKAADRLLFASSKWKDKPEAERFAEVVRLVKEQTGQAAAAPAPAASSNAEIVARAKQAAAAAPTAPVGISDLRGGAAPTKSAPDYRAMSDDQIMMSLPR